MDDDGKLIIKNENGVENEYSILVTFDIAEKNRSYVLFTDYSRTEDGYLRVYSAIYDKTGRDKSLKEVTEQDEIEVVEEYLGKLEQTIKKGTDLK